jgi:ABC-type branched-subunit amino acid transport system substrate-binding protein
MAAAQRGRRAAILSSYIESGYDSTAAFVAGFESAGGRVADIAVAYVPGSTETPAAQVSRLRGSGADFIYVNASGADAARLMAAAGADAIAAPFALPSSKPATPFAVAYRRATGAEPDAYALLGYEAGSLIQAAAVLRAAQGGSLAAALEQAAIDSPRGKVSMQASTHASRCGVYVDAGGSAINGLPAVDEPRALAHAGWQQAVSGWTLPYGAGTQTRRA